MERPLRRPDLRLAGRQRGGIQLVLVTGKRVVRQSHRLTLVIEQRFADVWTQVCRRLVVLGSRRKRRKRGLTRLLRNWGIFPGAA